MKEWYKQAFGSHYAEIYSHRDEEDARRAVRFILGLAEIRSDRGPVLDLCCGEGRHSFEMAQRAAAFVAGLDLSPSLLQSAQSRKKQSHQAPAFLRGDMRRLPFANAQFTLVLNLFTSFGYFLHAEENRQVLVEVSRVLRPGGYMLLDHIHPAWLRQHLQHKTERTTSGGIRVFEHRHIREETGRVEKEIEFEIQGEPQKVVESVQMYSPEEMRSLARSAGLETVRIYGDFDGCELSPQSPRAIYLFHSPTTEAT